MRLASLLLATLALLLPAAWNGMPLLYPDTPTYLRGAETGLMRLAGPGKLAPWVAPAPVPTTHLPAASAPMGRATGLTALDEQVVLAGRSVYYGALLEAAQLAGSLWWAAAFQALCVAWLLQLLLVHCWRLPAGAFLGITGALAVATPAGLFTGLLMPDVFAALGILALAILLTQGRALGTGQRVGLGLLLLFALCAHASHLATAALLLAAVALGATARVAARVGITPRRAWPRAEALSFALAAACVVGALLAEAAFSAAVQRAVGAPPLRLPHLSARLIDRGPGEAYLRQACPTLAPPARWAACDFIDRYPLAWTDFLFAREPGRGVFAPADTATKRRLSGEQLALAWAVLRHDPAGVLGGMAADVGRQLTMFQIDIWGLGPRELAMYTGRVPPPLLAAMEASRGAVSPQWQDRFSTVTRAAVLSSLVTLVILAGMWRRGQRGRPQHPGERALRAPDATALGRLLPISALVLAGVVLNAMVCAVAAAPLDRFQARVIWLLPLLALAGIATLWSARVAPYPPPEGTHS